MNKEIDFMRQDVLEMRRKLDSGEECFPNFLEELSPGDFMQALKGQIDKELKGDLCTIREELVDGTKEEAKYKLVVEKIGEKIDNAEKYINDLWTDIYMASFRVDSEYDIKPDDLMKLGWDSEACNSKAINVENAKKHYPLVDYGDEDFPMSGIPGGCKEYHQLMMQQKNIGFFDIGSDKESLKQYAFPRTHDMYQELKNSPIENLILLEKTQGIGYVNQLFPYLRNIAKKEQLKRLKKIIECIAEIPMFIRKDITDEIWSYLYCFEYNNNSIKCVEDTIYGIAYIVKKVYKKIWRFSWEVYKEGKFPSYALKGTLAMLWRDYFSEFEVYNDFLDSRGLCGWRDIEEGTEKDANENTKKDADENTKKDAKENTKEDIKKKDEGIMSCFIRCGKNGKTLLTKDRRGEEVFNMLAKERAKAQYLGEDGKNNKSGEEIVQEICKALKEQEDEMWERVDPRRKTEKLGPMDVYAIVHEDIVIVLNK